MDVVVDGEIYCTQAHGGISRYFNEIFPRMCDIEKNLHINLLIRGKLIQPLPEHSHIYPHAILRVVSRLQSRCIWRPLESISDSLIDHFWIEPMRDKIWHSTYYTMPRKWNGPSVVTVHDMTFEMFPDIYNGPQFDRFRERKRKCIVDADAVICVSETTRQEMQLSYGIDLDSVHIIHHACSDVFRQKEQCKGPHKMSDGRPFLLYVGSRSDYKNCSVLLEAYKKWSKNDEVELLFVGKPWTTPEKQYLSDLGVNDKVRLQTGVGDEALCCLYNQAVGFVYPSLYEGFGIPLLEAMNCGCPVIASRIPSTIEVAGDCPIYFEASDVEGLMRAFDKAHKQGKNSKYTQRGLIKANSYSWNKAADQTLKVYKKVYSSGTNTSDCAKGHGTR